MNNNSDIDYKKIAHYILIGLIVLGVLWLNYCSLDAHMSANSQLITDYQPEEDELARYRNPAVAGIFYSADKQRLDDEVEHYLADPVALAESQPRILIVPHAGYMYSAATAAKAYQQLRKYAKEIRTVVLVGPAHRVAVNGAALSNVDFFITPLGHVPVNKELVAGLSAQPGFHIMEAAHKDEHSLEVQLPFLQKVLPKFQIVPLVYGEISPERLANALQPLLNRPDTLIVISADLSHYYNYETAQKLDQETAAQVAAQEAELKSHQSCGATGINAALLLAQSAGLRPEMLELINSGDTAGDKGRVVGYGAWSFAASAGPESELPRLEQETANLQLFAQTYKDELFKITARSLVEAVKNHKHYSPSRQDYDNNLFNKGAAFVTLYQNQELRGCIGTIVPQTSIAHDIADNAYRAALEDSRFQPLQPDELEGLSYSISLLTGFEPVTYTDEADLLNKINPGIDGLILRDGNRQGVFLPTVWKQLPDKTEFLNNLKIKAGFSPSYWSNKIKVYRFRTVEINSNEN